MATDGVASPTDDRYAWVEREAVAGGQLASLKAALAFHAAHVGIDAAEGILFP